MIYAVKTDNDMYCVYDYERNVGTFVLAGKFDEYAKDKDIKVLKGKHGIKGVERYLYNVAVEDAIRNAPNR